MFQQCFERGACATDADGKCTEGPTGVVGRKAGYCSRAQLWLDGDPMTFTTWVGDCKEDNNNLDTDIQAYVWETDPETYKGKYRRLPVQYLQYYVDWMKGTKESC